MDNIHANKSSAAINIAFRNMCIISTNGNPDKSSGQVLLCVYNQTGWTRH